MRGRAATSFTLAALGIALLGSATGACDLGGIAEPHAGPATPVGLVPPRDFVSGTRLRARHHVVDGAVDVLIGFHDSKLDADCAFEDQNGAFVGPGGTSYCVPDGVARHRQGKGPFLDAACTVPAARTPVTGAAAYVMIEPNDACTTAPEIHVAAAPAVRGVYSSDGRGSCNSEGFASVQALGELAPEGAFVRAVEQVEPRPGRIGARVLVGDDGSRHVIGGFDLARGEASHVGTAEDGVVRWLPARPAFVGGGELLFADASCTVPAGSKIGRTATCPLTAVIELEGLCGLGKLFSIGEPLASVFRRDSNDDCVSGPAGDVLAFGLGARIEDAAYEPVVTTVVGPSRVGRRGVGAAGDAPVAWTELVDSVTNEPCIVLPTADGSLRCLPATSAGVALFADAACTEPAFALPAGCESGPDAHYVHDAFDVAARAFEVVRALDAVYETTARGCAPFKPVVDSRLYGVKELDTSTFPIAIERRD